MIDPVLELDKLFQIDEAMKAGYALAEEVLSEFAYEITDSTTLRKIQEYVQNKYQYHHICDLKISYSISRTQIVYDLSVKNDICPDFYGNTIFHY